MLFVSTEMVQWYINEDLKITNSQAVVDAVAWDKSAIGRLESSMVDTWRQYIEALQTEAEMVQCRVQSVNTSADLLKHLFYSRGKIQALLSDIMNTSIAYEIRKSVEWEDIVKDIRYIWSDVDYINARPHRKTLSNYFGKDILLVGDSIGEDLANTWLIIAHDKEVAWKRGREYKNDVDGIKRYLGDDVYDVVFNGNLEKLAKTFIADAIAVGKAMCEAKKMLGIAPTPSCVQPPACNGAPYCEKPASPSPSPTPSAQASSKSFCDGTGLPFSSPPAGLYSCLSVRACGDKGSYQVDNSGNYIRDARGERIPGDIAGDADYANVVRFENADGTYGPVLEFCGIWPYPPTGRNNPTCPLLDPNNYSQMTAVADAVCANKNNPAAWPQAARDSMATAQQRINAAGGGAPGQSSGFLNSIGDAIKNGVKNLFAPSVSQNSSSNGAKGSVGVSGVSGPAGVQGPSGAVAPKGGLLDSLKNLFGIAPSSAPKAPVIDNVVLVIPAIPDGIGSYKTNTFSDASGNSVEVAPSTDKDNLYIKIMGKGVVSGAPVFFNVQNVGISFAPLPSDPTTFVIPKKALPPLPGKRELRFGFRFSF